MDCHSAYGNSTDTPVEINRDINEKMRNYVNLPSNKINRIKLSVFARYESSEVLGQSD
jgi:hypothetical protein